MSVAEPTVSFYGLPRRAAADRALIKQTVAEVAASDSFILKSRVEALEAALAERLGVAHVIAVSSGSAAVIVALATLDLQPGDEVVTPAFGFHSSLTAVARAGGRPVLADVTEDAVLDPSAARDVAGPRTRALIPVHVFAACADMAAISEIARNVGAKVVENSAVAIGFDSPAGRPGALGDISIFSFHPYKPLAGVTDGGAVVTRDGELATIARQLRNHGQDGKTRFLHHRVGFNARMDEIAAAVLRARLDDLDGKLARRTAIALRYDGGLEDLSPELSLPGGDPTRTGCYAYVVRSARRDELERHLLERGVESLVYYPRPLHLQTAFADLGYREGQFPVAERICREALALPLYPEMPERDVERVIAAVREFHGA